jgi:predicted nucleotidyltransferase/plasmid stability protein
MRTRTLTVRGVPDGVLRALRAASAANRRSLNAELLVVLERAAGGVREEQAGLVREAAAARYGTRRAAARGALRQAVDGDALAAVCRRHHIRSLAVFGSRGRGDARPDSDVDVVVEFEPGMTPGLGVVSVAEALGAALGGARVDLVTRRGLSPRLRRHIESTAVQLYGA